MDGLVDGRVEGLVDGLLVEGLWLGDDRVVEGRRFTDGLLVDGLLDEGRLEREG